MEPISIAGATAQANCSVSRRGVIRGVHFASVPPGAGEVLHLREWARSLM